MEIYEFFLFKPLQLKLQIQTNFHYLAKKIAFEENIMKARTKQIHKS